LWSSRRSRRSHIHPDLDEAREWVRDEIDRLQVLGYGELERLRTTPRHRAFTSHTGRPLVGETSVHWDSGEGGPLRVLVDVWEPRRWRLNRSVCSDSFARSS
jgi:hypothetical protein